MADETNIPHSYICEICERLKKYREICVITSNASEREIEK